MKTISFIFILLLSLTANEWSHAQSIAMRVPDTTVVSGSSFDLPIYVDSSFTGKNVMSYMLQLSFNQSYLQPVSVIYSGTKCAPFGSPSVNTTIAGKITIAAAGTSPLIGKGIFIIIRFSTIISGYTPVSFSGSNNNFFNEGNPTMELNNGSVSILAPPSITIFPDNGIIAKGEHLQFNVYDGIAPYQWFVSNSNVASIDVNGLLTGNLAGSTKVVARDSLGICDTSNLVTIRAMRLSIPSDLSQLQGTYIDVPINTSSLSSLNIYSGSFRLGYNKNLLTPISVIQTGTLLASYAPATVNINTQGSINVAFAGTSPLTGSGTLIYIRFNVSTQNSGGDWVSFVNGIFDQTYTPAFTNGFFTTINLPELSIAPNTANIAEGETQEFNVNGGGTAPFNWSVNDTSLASINSSGMLTAKRSGVVVVSAHDALGAIANSGNIHLFDTRIILPDTAVCPEASVFDYPIRIGALPSGQSIFALQARVHYDPNLLILTGIETQGTLTQGWNYANNASIGQIIIAASGTAPFNNAGTLFRLKFNVNQSFTAGSSANISITNVILNEGIPSPLVDLNGYIVGVNPEQAGNISGYNIVCPGQVGVMYTVAPIAGATGYVWTLPYGAIITAGENTNSISVDFSSGAVSGNINVYGTNYCGNGGISSDFGLTVSNIRTVSLHFILEGLYNPNTNGMYEAMDGNTGEPQWGFGIADRINIELFEENAPYSPIGVNFNEVSLSTEGLASFQIGSSYDGNYYLRISNRNHLATWTAFAVPFSSAIIDFDFRVSAYQAYGSYPQVQVAVNPDVFAFYLGDLDQGGWVDSDDFNLFEPDLTMGATGYYATDFNGSGWVDSDDFNLFEPRLTDGNASEYPGK